MTALVTGGGGFLGLAIIRRLVARGGSVRSFSRSRHAALDELGVQQALGDLASPDDVLRAAAECDIVFHVAAKAGFWGPHADYYRTNVTGTENIIAACRECRIQRMVYTSSPSVVFSGASEENIDESAPYAKRFLAHYPETKALAEQTVLAANGPGLATVALRPHLIWGPGDNHLIPRLVARAQAGKLRIIGDGRNRVDCTYIDNAADAHILAADRLHPGSPIAGRTYFLAQDEPVLLWEFINRILDCAGVPPVTKRIPAGIAYAAGAVLEAAHRLFRLPGEPRMTRFLAKQLSTCHWFNLAAARRDLGYEPRVNVEEGLARLRESLQKQAGVR